LATSAVAFALTGIDAFYGDSHVLEQVSFSLGEGRLLGLLGRNGAGKSTCMNVAVGLLPPRRGTVELFGIDVSRLQPEMIAAHGLALVPQGRRIFKSLTVRENLVVAARRPDPGSRHAPWTIDTVFGMFPRLAERQEADRGASFRRRAADARDRPRADGQSARAADGRAVGGPGAADRGRRDGDDPHAQGERPVDRAGRAEPDFGVRCRG
jgi:ABC-type Fe3+/spermidine/putrescine transport system ATPase subunit